MLAMSSFQTWQKLIRFGKIWMTIIFFSILSYLKINKFLKLILSFLHSFDQSDNFNFMIFLACILFKNWLLITYFFRVSLFIYFVFENHLEKYIYWKMIYFFIHLERVVWHLHLFKIQWYCNFLWQKLKCFAKTRFDDHYDFWRKKSFGDDIYST